MKNPSITIRFCEAIFETCPWIAPKSYLFKKAKEDQLDKVRSMFDSDAFSELHQDNIDRIFDKAKKHTEKKSS